MTTTAITSKIGRQDLGMYDGVSTTFTRRTSAGGTFTLSRIGNMVDVCSAYGDSTTRTAAILNFCTSTIGTTNTLGLDFGVGEWTIDVDASIPANMIPVVNPGASFAISSGKVLTFGAQVVAGSYRIFTGAGTVAFAAGSFVKTSWFGGIVNLMAGLSGTPNINVVFDMDETITEDLAVTDNIRVSSPYGYTVTINDGVTLTISGQEDSGNPLTVVLVGSGAIVYGSSSGYSTSYIYPQIYGAVGDGTTNDTVAMQLCLDAGYDLNVPIYLPPGSYSCLALTYGSNATGEESDCAPLLYGAGDASIIKARSGIAGVFISAKNIKNKTLRDFCIDCNDVAGITEGLNTDWYEDGDDLNNVYRNIKIKKYAAVGWSAEYNNGSCVFDNIVCEDPTTDTNQKALDFAADVLNLTNSAIAGYIAFTGDNLKVDSCKCYGLSATADNVTVINAAIQSNSVTDACIDGTIDSLNVIGGSLVTVVGRNHIKGTYDNGGVFHAVVFDGASAEDIFESSVAAGTGYAEFTFLAAELKNVTFNDPAGVLLFTETTPVSVKRTVYLYTGAAQYFAVEKHTSFVLAEVYGGGMPGYLTNGGTGGGYSIKKILKAALSASETVTVGTASGTTSFGPHVSASGGTAGTPGVGSGGDINLTGGFPTYWEDGGGTTKYLGGVGAGPLGGRTSAGNGYAPAGGGAYTSSGVPVAYNGTAGLCIVTEYR